MSGPSKLMLAMPLVAVVVGTLVGASGCERNGTPPIVCTVTAPTACPEPAPRYADVAPIIGQHCAAPCHWGMPGGPWPLTDYPHVADWADVVRDEVLNCTMPPPEDDTEMTDTDRTAILTWIRCGFPE